MAKSSLDSLICRKELYYQRVQTLYDLIDHLEDPKSLKEFEIRYVGLEDTRAEYTKVIFSIDELMQKTEKYKPNFQALDAFDTLYCHVKKAAERLSKKSCESEKVPKSDVNLPRLSAIEIPNFNGDIKNWPLYYESFKALVHDNSALSDADKVHYLVGSLRGRAVSICAGIPPLPQNYEILWKRLVDRFQNPRTLARDYLKQMLDFKPMTNKSANNFYYFLENFDAAYQALDRLGINNLYDFVITHLALTKLDPESRDLFENQKKPSHFPEYAEVVEFIKDQALRCDIVQDSSSYKRSESRPSTGVMARPNKSKNSHSFVVKSADSCLYCQSTLHDLEQCSDFQVKSPMSRFRWIKKRNRCLICFGEHSVKNCKKGVLCSICKLPHHKLLHFPQSAEGKATLLSVKEDEVSSKDVTFCSVSGPKQGLCCTVLLSTVVVDVVDGHGNLQAVRMLLDSGSTSNFLTSSCARRLNLKIAKDRLSVQGMGVGNRTIYGKTTTYIVSRLSSQNKYGVEFLLVPKITSSLPSRIVQKEALTHIDGLILADPGFDRPERIDGILGAGIFSEVVQGPCVKGNRDQPLAWKTTLGYVLMGNAPISSSEDKEPSVSHSFATVVDENLENLVARFWELEELTRGDNLFEESECERSFRSMLGREPSGRYVVGLPFKRDPSSLGDSFKMAFRRFTSLEKKFARDPEFKLKYCSIIQEYLDAGYLAKTAWSFDGPHYILPHHGIFKEGSSSTPLRCVLDASAKTSSSLSLNDILFSGPKLQADVFNLFLNFRLFEIALTADIRKMYLQILLRPEHRRFQRILWRFSTEDPVELYQFNTVSFGIKSSPFLAQRTIRQLVADEGRNYPLAAEVAIRDLYMDDLVTSVEGVEAGNNLYSQLYELFSLGGFELLKWTTNLPHLVAIPEMNRSPEVVDFETDQLKILGLQWQPKNDYFAFKIIPYERACTKRNVLSFVARLFDPLGFVSPVTLYLKSIIKELWKLGISWDETPPLKIQQAWSLIASEFPLLGNCKVSRHLGTSSKLPVTLIGYADASNLGYGAVVYSKVLLENKEVKTGLICSKTKVAPMKFESIPRLELCAALLLARLLEKVVTIYSPRVQIKEIYALSDSTVVLNWIGAPSYKWPTFIANRVAKIHSMVDQSRWFHISGKNNMADGLSRGLSPKQLLNFEEWWMGPSWLSQESRFWPIQVVPSTNSVELATSFLACEPAKPRLYSLIEYFSSFPKLLRAVGYVLRFGKILKSTGQFTPADLDIAEKYVLRAVQSFHFSADLQLLRSGRPCSSKLQVLNPFVQDGLLRVGGRLRNAAVAEDMRHPFLLPKKDPLVDLLIDHCHRSNLHTGPHLVTSILRQKYWILSVRSVVRYRLRKCNICFKIKPHGPTPMMADLPLLRVTEAKPFLHCGVDYAGPFLITFNRHRGVRSQKAYVCLFVCFATKAIHLELASDLSTNKFLEAFKRFLSRRGACQVIHSDCGTNFIGAKNELDSLFKFVTSPNYVAAVEKELTEQKVSWKLQPPSAPHFSGIWEANIKSVKSHLSKVIGDQILTYEEFNTVLIEIEALLNSRPLCWFSSDPSDPIALTPSHFLNLTPLKWLPLKEISESTSLVSRKALLDNIIHEYWKRWRNEYLTQLQARYKWNTPQLPVQVGMVVLLKSERVPALHWPTGIIEKIFPGKDGIIRVVEVRTKTGVYRRPVVKICPLPTQ